ncbi:FAD-dependent oxidoreductase [Spirillospora sp. CA-108201]
MAAGRRRPPPRSRPLPLPLPQRRTRGHGDDGQLRSDLIPSSPSNPANKERHARRPRDRHHRREPRRSQGRAGPAAGSRLFARRHLDHGVDLRTGDGLEAILGTRSVEAVQTITGSRIPADLVTVGAVPNTELAEAAGLHVDGGIVADRHLRTSHPAAVTAGDVARHHHPRYLNPIRIEHWDNAVVHGTAAAATLLGEPVTVDHVPYFFSTQYGSMLEYVGHPTAWDHVVTRGEPGAPGFTAFWLDHHIPVAAMTTDNWGAADHLRTIVAEGHPIDAHLLADEAAMNGGSEYQGDAR